MVTNWGAIPESVTEIEKSTRVVQNLLVGDGDIFYVDSGASGAGLGGRTPDDAFATLALGVAAAIAGDTIILLAGHAETISTEVALAVAGLRVIGEGVGARRPSLSVSGAINGISLDAANILVENLLFNEGSAAGSVNIDVAAADCTIRGCQFDQSTNEDCITVAAGGDRLVVEGNKFNVTGDGADSGVLLEAAGVDDVEIRENYFLCSDGTNVFDVGAIETTAAHTRLLVHDNIFNGNGIAATAVSGTAALTRGIVDNIYLSDAIDVDTQRNSAELRTVAAAYGATGTGNTWYVDSVNGAATNDGLSPNRALVTVDAAINAATAGDNIIVMEAHVETLADATSLVMDVVGIKIIGQGHGARRPTFTMSAAGSNIPVSAASCEMSNLLFTVGSGPVDVVGAITVTAADVFLDKIECRETVGETDEQFDAGIVVSTAAHQCQIKDFKFTGVAGDATLAAGILVSAIVRNLVIEDPWIVGDFLGACINLSAAATTARIIRPVLYQQDAVVEECILADSGVTGTVEHARLQSDINTAAGFDNIITAAAMAVFDIQIVNNPGENSFVGSLSDLDVSDALSQARVYSTAEG